MLFSILGILFGLFMVASPLLTLRAIWLHSWVMMWMAALISLLVGSVLIFSLGGVVFLLMNIQVAATYAWRRSLTRTEALTPLILAAVLWILIVPIQAFGPVWFGGFGCLPLVATVVLGVLLLPIDWSSHRPALAR